VNDRLIFMVNIGLRFVVKDVLTGGEGD
jgi:hypothetical protein